MEKKPRIRKDLSWNQSSVLRQFVISCLLLGMAFSGRSSGVIDPGFSAPPALLSGSIKAVRTLSDGKTIVVSMNGYTRLNSDGSQDSTYHGGTISARFWLDAATILEDGRVILEGPSLKVNGTTFGNIVRLLGDGTVDPAFTSLEGDFAPSGVHEILLDASGRIYVAGGDLRTLGGETVNHIARLTSNGAIDASFEFTGSLAYNAVTAALFANGDLILTGSGTDALSLDVVRLNDQGNVIPGLTVTTGPAAANNSFVVIDPSQRIIMGSTVISSGEYTFTNSLIRFMENGVIDPGLEPREPASSVTPGAYQALVIDRVGRYYIAGGFESYGGVERKKLTRLFPDGSLDESFVANLDSPADKISLAPDGALMVAGNFTTLNGASVTSPVRLLVDDLDETAKFQMVNTNIFVFDSIGTTLVSVMRVGPTNTAASVDFGLLDGSAAADTDYVDASGTLDFAPGEDVKYLGISVLNDGTIKPTRYLTINLSSPSAGTEIGARSSARFTIVDSDARISFDAAALEVSEGDLAASIKVNREGMQTVSAVRLMAVDGTAVDDIHFRFASSLLQFKEGESSKDFEFEIVDDSIVNEDRSFSSSFESVVGASLVSPQSTEIHIHDDDIAGMPGLGFSFWENIYARGVQSLAQDSQGRLIAGGGFSGVNGSPVNNVVRLLPSGDIDPSFHLGAGANGPVYSVAVDSADRILIAGDFTAYNDVTVGRVVRLVADGTLDPTFDVGTGFDSIVERVEIEPDGRILAGGFFQNCNGKPRLAVALLSDSGVLDETFVPDSGISPYGNYVGHGAFYSPAGIVVTGTAQTDGTNAVFRLSLSGQRDSNFSVVIGPQQAYPYVTGVVVQPDGKLVIAGSFSQVDGVTRNNLARINSDGTLDETFDPGSGADGWVYRVCGQPDGKFILVGFFGKYDGVARPYVARINSDGSLDTSFMPTTGPDESVAAALFNQDGSITLGGGFLRFNTFRRSGLATVDADGGLELTVPNFLSSEISGTKLNLSVNVEPEIDVRLLQSQALNAWLPIVTNRTYKRVIQFAPDISASGNGFFQAERLDP